ncbi:MAG: hypothetical protein C5B50_00945 [Verrucomicrobia bacterium]|nr:MAG: hypothetical protein C5B50_00945 [Verrucomicrobiota bacterium]
MYWATLRTNDGAFLARSRGNIRWIETLAKFALRLVSLLEVSALLITPKVTHAGPSGPVDQLETRAAAGDSNSQAVLASEYEFGERRTQDFTKAFYWYSRAAAQTNLNGELGVGNAYLTGHGVERNEAIADALTIKLASEGATRSYRGAGIALEIRGMRAGEQFIKEPLYLSEARPKSRFQPYFIQAYKWFNLACVEGDPDAPKDRAEVLDMMTEESIKAGQEASAAFKPVPRTGLQFDASGKLVCSSSLNLQGTDFLSGLPSASRLPSQAELNDAFARRLARASNGPPWEQFDIGIDYIRGLGVQTNLDLGLFWVRKAETQGFPEAKEFLRTNSLKSSPR